MSTNSTTEPFNEEKFNIIIANVKNIPVKLTSEIEAELAEIEKQRIEAERIAEENRVNRVRIPIPHDDWVITAEYENQDEIHITPHTGLDWGGSLWGTDAYPIAKGIVTFSGEGWIFPGCGNWASVYHEKFDKTTIYCHLDSLPYVQEGQFVDPDTAIGRIGDTGYSFGTHLHLGVYEGDSLDNSINPRLWLEEIGVF